MIDLALKEIDLKFNDEGGKHIHILVGEDVPGCTSVSGLFGDDGWKFAWPPKLMGEKLTAILKERAINEEDIKKAKSAWREKRDKAADSGTRAHALIETYIRHHRIDAFLEDKEVENCVENFLVWEQKYKPKWLASELQVGSLTHKFAGILDALAEIDGKIVLLDFKTSSGIKAEYNIQLAGLMICLEEMGLKPDVRAILHLPKDGAYEYRVIDSNLEQEKIDFLAGLAFLRRKNLFASRNK